MIIQSGLWIDHRQTIIVILGNAKPEFRHVAAEVEKHLTHAGVSGPRDDTITDQRDHHDRKYDQDLIQYYDAVIASFPNVGQLLIMGPGEAKVELQRRMEDRGHGSRIAEVRTADAMTEPQIVAAIRRYYENSSVTDS